MTVLPPAPRFTIVSFHAHPDDEALLTSGTLARAAAEGHRVVIVVATSGEAGLAENDSRTSLGAVRRHELMASAQAIGAHRVESLGYADSGSVQPFASGGFSQVEPELIAAELALILLEEHADVLTIYDPRGGYGHPDHVQVYRTGRRAAELAGTRVVLEATVDRTLISRVGRLLGLVSRFVPLFDIPDLTTAYTARRDLTHRVDVRAHLDSKRGSLRSHASQRTGGPRTLSLLLRLPQPLQPLVLGHEWFVEIGRTPNVQLLDDIFATLRINGSIGQADAPPKAKGQEGLFGVRTSSGVSAG